MLLIRTSDYLHYLRIKSGSHDTGFIVYRREIVHRGSPTNSQNDLVSAPLATKKRGVSANRLFITHAFRFRQVRYGHGYGNNGTETGLCQPHFVQRAAKMNR